MTCAHAQDVAFEFDKDVVKISQAITNHESIEKWKHKDYFNSLDFLREIRYNVDWNENFYTPEAIKRPDNNSMVAAYLIEQIGLAIFEDKNVDIDSLCRHRIDSLSEKTALFSYYNYVFTNVFPSNFLEKNNVNLSAININLDSLSLKDETEKMIVFISASNRFVWGKSTTDFHLRVIDHKVIDLENSCPTINESGFLHFKLLPYNNFKVYSASFKQEVELYKYTKAHLQILKLEPAPTIIYTDE